MGYFKYTNFLLSSLETLGIFGKGASSSALVIILPLGISFYTFKAMSYIVDAYRKQQEPVSNFTDFFLYLSFFPHLAAGPIVRAKDFLPQLKTRSRPGFEDWQFAIYRIARGFFLKLIVADHIATSANSVFAGDYQTLSIVSSWLGAIFFAVQILCDFAGYSDIAIGLGRLLGFRTPENFDNPYFSSSLGEFWRRWHISLSTWFRDYVYFPLARSKWMSKFVYSPLTGSRFDLFRTAIPTLTMFVLSGLWHGANWTFLLWGFLHGLGVVVERQTGMYALQQRQDIKGASARLAWGFATLMFIVFAWVPFRAADVFSTFQYWNAMFFGGLQGNFLSSTQLNGLFWLTVFLIYQMFTSIKENRFKSLAPALQRAESWAYFAAILFIANQPADFIYFRF
ncbi:MAG: MBOAT family O-acyltransferase [Anaerolineales bacterium]